MDSYEVKKILYSLGADLCVEVCPVNALEETNLRQQLCWDYAFGDNQESKTWEISCHKCRDICPYHLGSKNRICE